MEAFVVGLTEAEEAIRAVVEPLLDSESFELVRVSYKKAQNKGLLNIYVDTKDNLNKITMDQVTDVSRLLSDVLDAAFEDSKLLHGRYDLQVSSPGLDRPLTKQSHFERAVNEKVRLKIRNPAGGSYKTQGELLAVSPEGGVVVKPEDRHENLYIKYDDLMEANIIFQFDRPQAAVK